MPINELVGYGLIEDGKPKGIWPLPLAEQRKAKERYMKTVFDSKVVIVPIYIGEPLLEASNERLTFAGKSNR